MASSTEAEAEETAPPETYTFPVCDAWDVSALLAMRVRTDVLPTGSTWREFLASLHYLTVQIMTEARRVARSAPYRTIPHPEPERLAGYVVAMKSQYTLRGEVCKVRVGFAPGGRRRLGVFATARLEPGSAVTTLPVDAIYTTHYGGNMLTWDDAPVDPATVVLHNTRHADLYVASSLLYACPERCGHLISHASEGATSNVEVDDLFGGVFHVVRTTRAVEEDSELFF